MSRNTPSNENKTVRSLKNNDNKKRTLWSILFVGIAVLTIWTVTSQNKSFNISSFREYLSAESPVYLVGAVICSLGYVFFEAIAVKVACRAFGYKIGVNDGIVYSSADIYFSAITPSATGGQPVCALFMIRDGIPGTAATAVLLANLSMYTLSITTIGVFVMILFPGVFASFGTLSQTLIIIGLVIQVGLTLFFMLLLKNEKLLHKICYTVVNFLCKIKILRHRERKLEKLSKYMTDYGAHMAVLKGRTNLMLKVFLFNLAQRLSTAFVTVFVYLSSGGNFASAPKLFAVQSFSVLGSNCIPIPGAMGVSDYLLLDGFGELITGEGAANLELLSRGLSFYFCIVLCGLIVLFNYLVVKRRKKNAGIL